jgi:hypothetical protein
MKKHGIRMLGVCLMAALGLVAIVATSAQGEATSKWVLKKGAELISVTDTLLPVPQVTELENKTGTLLATIGTVKTKILCTGMEFEEAVLKLEGSALGKIRFTGCIIELNEKLSAPCKPHTGAESGVILTLLLKGLVVLHAAGSPANEGYLKLVNESFPTNHDFVNIELGEECSIGESLPVNGEFTMKDVNKLGREEKLTHLAAEFEPLTKLFVIDLKAEHKATLDGSAIIGLTGTHSTYEWAGIPG